MPTPNQKPIAHRMVMHSPASLPPSSVAAFSLIELIGVLAVIAILATVIFTVTIKSLDRVANDQELAQLQTINQALRSSILRNGYIPKAYGTSNWVQMVAQEMGSDEASVSANGRRLPRYLLIDPAIQIGGIGATVMATNGYRQTPPGSAAPTNPRLLILSSIGVPLPAAISNGVPASSADFDGIWNAADGALPTGSAWTSWKGVNDLKINRVNLQPLFVHLYLRLTNSVVTSPGISALLRGNYSINRTAATGSPDGVDAYFLQNSVLTLSSKVAGPSGIDWPPADQILITECAFVLAAGGGWRGGLSNTNAPPTDIYSQLVSPEIMDLLAWRFLNSPGNPGSGEVDMQYYPGLSGDDLKHIKSNQSWLVKNYSLFMQTYIDWANTGFWNDDLKNRLSKISDQMKSMAEKLDDGMKEGVTSPPP